MDTTSAIIPGKMMADLAATRLQAVTRGHQSRKSLSVPRQQRPDQSATVRLAAARLIQRMQRAREAKAQRIRRALAVVTVGRWARACLARRRARQWRHAEMRAQANAAARVQQQYRAARGVSLPGYSGETDEAGRPHGSGRMVEHDGGWYEGEWVGGVRHGEGRRLQADGSMYEGQWQDDEPHGAGSHVDGESGIRRHGEWQRGRLHGEGALVVPVSAGKPGVRAASGGGGGGRVAYDYSGQFEAGLRHGLGSERRDGDTYEGQWQEDMRHGLGTATADGTTYRGEWRAGVRHGQGEHTSGGGHRLEGVWESDDLPHGTMRGKWNGVYVGQLRGLRRHGTGRWEGPQGRVYEGEWREDQWWGKGSYTTPLSSYTGGFERSKRHGFGSWVGPSGERYEGEWAGDTFHGHGVRCGASGGMYAGQWHEGKRHGAGNFTAPSAVRYSGQWARGERHGRGVQRHPDGSVYDGEWVEGRKHGQGRWTDVPAATAATGATPPLGAAGRARPAAAAAGAGAGAAPRPPQPQIYEGGYLGGVRHGVAVWRSERGDAYAGHCKGGTMGGGAGRFAWADGERYVGGWLDPERDGQLARRMQTLNRAEAARAEHELPPSAVGAGTDRLPLAGSAAPAPAASASASASTCACASARSSAPGAALRTVPSVAMVRGQIRELDKCLGAAATAATPRGVALASGGALAKALAGGTLDADAVGAAAQQLLGVVRELDGGGGRGGRDAGCGGVVAAAKFAGGSAASAAAKLRAISMAARLSVQ